jgi:hypothetical protein
MTTVRAKLAPLYEGPHLDEDARGSLLSTLAEIPADELRDQLQRTVHVLDGLVTAAEQMDLATYCLCSPKLRRKCRRCWSASRTEGNHLAGVLIGAPAHVWALEDRGFLPRLIEETRRMDGVCVQRWRPGRGGLQR